MWKLQLLFEWSQKPLKPKPMKWMKWIFHFQLHLTSHLSLPPHRHFTSNSISISFSILNNKKYIRNWLSQIFILRPNLSFSFFVSCFSRSVCSSLLFIVCRKFRLKEAEEENYFFLSFIFHFYLFFSPFIHSTWMVHVLHYIIWAWGMGMLKRCFFHCCCCHSRAKDCVLCFKIGSI